VQVLAPIFACILDCFLVHAGRHRRCDFWVKLPTSYNREREVCTEKYRTQPRTQGFCAYCSQRPWDNPTQNMIWLVNVSGSMRIQWKYWKLFINRVKFWQHGCSLRVYAKATKVRFGFLHDQP
jgi:hypothetical protein